MEEEEEEVGGRAVIAEIRAKRNDADAGKRVRRENERMREAEKYFSSGQGLKGLGLQA